MRFDGCRRNQLRGGPAGDERGRDHDVVVGDALGQRLLLPPLLILGQLARIAARRLLAGHAEVEEGRAEALHLLPHHGTHVEAGDDRPEPARGCDRLQSGDTGTEHEHLRRRDGSGCGHQHRKEAGQAFRREEHGLVPGDGRL